MSEKPLGGFRARTDITAKEAIRKTFGFALLWFFRFLSQISLRQLLPDKIGCSCSEIRLGFVRPLCREAFSLTSSIAIYKGVCFSLSKMLVLVSLLNGICVDLVFYQYSSWQNTSFLSFVPDWLRRSLQHRPELWKIPFQSTILLIPKRSFLPLIFF